MQPFGEMLSGMGSINIFRGYTTIRSRAMHRSPSLTTVRLTHRSQHLRAKAALSNMPQKCYLDDAS
eukprot:5991349-Amphidinium_carterae.1